MFTKDGNDVKKTIFQMIMQDGDEFIQLRPSISDLVFENNHYPDNFTLSIH